VLIEEAVYIFKTLINTKNKIYLESIKCSQDEP